MIERKPTYRDLYKDAAAPLRATWKLTGKPVVQELRKELSEYGVKRSAQIVDHFLDNKSIRLPKWLISTIKRLAL